MVDGVLIQCVSLVCRSLSAFLLSAYMSVWSIASICMSQELVSCWNVAACGAFSVPVFVCAVRL